jgi:hypothetical protein
MTPNNQFSTMRFSHNDEVLTEVQHGSIPVEGEAVKICNQERDVILRGKVESVIRQYRKYNVSEHSHDANLTVRVRLEKVFTYNPENDE